MLWDLRFLWQCLKITAFWDVMSCSPVECEIWGAYSCVAENSGLVACDNISLSKCLLIFQRIIATSSSRVKQSEKTVNCLTFEDKRATILWNVRNLSPHDTALHPKRPESLVWYKLPGKALGSHNSAATILKSGGMWHHVIGESSSQPFSQQHSDTSQKTRMFRRTTTLHVITSKKMIIIT